MQEKKIVLDSKNVLKSILKIATPTLLSNVITSLYQIIDTKFIAIINEKALAAMAIVYPVNVVIFAISIGLGIGSTTILSSLIGKKDYEKAEIKSGYIIFFSIVISIIFTFLGIFYTDKIVSVISSNDPIIDAYAAKYIKITLLGSIAIFLPNAASDILKSEGNAFDPMVTLSIGAIINVILDPILMFGSFNLGISGAAIATVIARAISGAVTVGLLFRKKNLIIPKFNICAKKLYNISLKIIKFGYAPMIATALTASVVYFINSIASSYDISSLTFISVMVTLSDSLIMLPIYGLAQGLIPVASYNFSSNRKVEFLKTVKYVLISSLIISIIGGSIFILSSEYILRSFITSEDIILKGVKAFTILGFSYMIACPTITCAAILQSIHKTGYLAITALMRSIIILIPLGIYLSNIFGIKGLWYSFIFAELSALTFTSIILWIEIKKIKN
jgi:putative MATE family efflux protein